MWPFDFARQCSPFTQSQLGQPPAPLMTTSATENEWIESRLWITGSTVY